MVLILNHHFFTGLFLATISMVVSLGAVLTEEFASGMAMVSGSEGFASVRLGLWYGISKTAGRREVFRYQWCEVDSPSFHGSNCTQLQVARTAACLGVCLLVALLVLLALLITYSVRTRLEGRLTRIAAGLCASASLCFTVCLAVWAVLVLSLSTKGEDSKAQLSIGMSWLAEGVAFIFAFLLTVNLLQTARRIEAEVAASQKAAAGVEGGQGTAGGAVAMVTGSGIESSSSSSHKKAVKPSQRRRPSHGGVDLDV